jgi:16S rRNA C967 or C1407 C5-methylase (RsmB/RsmF family)/NOL1/NOP2/fmu family ribosome biogenesis protein
LQLPEKLLASLTGIKGFDKEAFEKIHQSGEQVTSVRMNPGKISMVNGEWIKLRGGNIYNSQLPIPHSILTTHHSQIPWTTHGYYLSERPAFIFDPLLHAGTYYVQEASSMFLEQVLTQTTDITQPLRVLDLCAAPGGKSTLIQSLITGNSLLVSNEVIKSRTNVLTENITKWGAANVIVTNNDPKDFAALENYFDVIVIDAPCSGSGLFRRDSNAVDEWSEENVMLCSKRQQRILADIFPALKENGVLIYSTCSYSKQEDEDILKWMEEGFRVEGLRLTVEERWNIVEIISGTRNSYGYRFFPDKIKGEGFFIAAFRKKESGIFLFPRSKKTAFEWLNKNEETIIDQWVKKDDGYISLKKENCVFTLPVDIIHDLHFLHSVLYIKKAGIFTGKLAQNELIPEHELALSTIICEDIPAIEVSEEQAIKYLQKENFDLSSNKKGWNIIRYNHFNLGLVKMLQNRFNNYYPSEWRILKRK